GFTAINCDYDLAVEINEHLQNVKDMPLMEAVNYFYGNVKDKSTRDILIKSFQTANTFATGVLNVTRREIQKARSGRAGKSFIDKRDSLFCDLTGATQLSILAPEGAAAQNTIKSLVSELSGALGNASTETANETMQEVLKVMKAQGAEIEK